MVFLSVVRPVRLIRGLATAALLMHFGWVPGGRNAVPAPKSFQAQSLKLPKDSTMKCDSKMMLKIAGGLGLALGVAYFTLPAAQALILASAPILLALICPVAMLLMMKPMNGGSRDEGARPDKITPVPRAVETARDEA